MVIDPVTPVFLLGLVIWLLDGLLIWLGSRSFRRAGYWVLYPR